MDLAVIEETFSQYQGVLLVEPLRLSVENPSILSALVNESVAKIAAYDKGETAACDAEGAFSDIRATLAR